MIARPTILELAPRRFRIVDSKKVPTGQDFRPGGLAMIAISVGMLIFFDINFRAEPLVPSAIVILAVIGVAIIIRTPMTQTREPLLELNLSAGIFSVPTKTSNGSGDSLVEYEVEEVDELLFAMRDYPLDPDNQKSVVVNAFALYIRLFGGELLPVVPASLDKDQTFRVGRFLSEAFDVGIKQVGKGWKE